MDLAQTVLGAARLDTLRQAGCGAHESLNLTQVAARMSHYVNGVSLRHEETSRDMFPENSLNYVTNGVHAATWAGPALAEVFDRHVPLWRTDNSYLRWVVTVPLDEIESAHQEAKTDLLEEVERRTGVPMDPHALTVGFARRVTSYKRFDLLFSDLDRLRTISSRVGTLQIIMAGKAHPRDEEGKQMIRRVLEVASVLSPDVRVVFPEEYDFALGRVLCAGADLWLNTPEKGMEASGTSGMKAAVNGVPSLSVLDGWWVEGHVEGVTGWAIGSHWSEESNPRLEAQSLYDKLEYVIAPMYYGDRKAFSAVMRSTIAVNASYFNAQRMLGQYIDNAYSLNGKT